MNLKTSRSARHPTNGSSLTICIAPDGLSRLLIRKFCAWAPQRKAEHDLRTFDRPGVLIEDLNDKGSHNPPFQVVHPVIARERNHL